MNDSDVIGEDDDLEMVAVGGILDRLHGYAYAPIPEEDSARAQCRCPEYVVILCDYISVKEKLRSARVYPSLVAIGHGMRLYNIKKEEDLVAEVSNRLDELRSSNKRNDRKIASVIGGIEMNFDGDRHPYRLEKTLVAQISECAKKCGVSTTDMYLYYFLIGIKELVEKENTFSHVAEFKEFKNAMRIFDDINEGLEMSKILITSLETK